MSYLWEDFDNFLIFVVLILCHVDVTFNINHILRNEKKKLYTSFFRPSAVAASSQSLHSVNYVMQSLRRSITAQSHLSPGPPQADDVVGNQIVTSQVRGGESAVY